MESIIAGITSFLASGAIIVIGAHIASTFARVHAGSATPEAHAETPAPAAPVQPEASPYVISPHFEVHRRAFNARESQPYCL